MAKNEIAYDSVIIQRFAQRLYREAAFAIVTSTFFGILVGAVVAGAGDLLVNIKTQGGQSYFGMAVLIGAIIGAIGGYSRGSERAFKLKLDAQIALCQVQMERNAAEK